MHFEVGVTVGGGGVTVGATIAIGGGENVTAPKGLNC